MIHSKTSPSGAERWVNCPGSIELCEGLPEEEPSEYARLGTAAHDICERKLSHKLLKEDHEITIREILRRHDFLTREEASEIFDYANEYVKHCQHYLLDDYRIEEKFIYNEMLYGTADFLTWNNNALCIIDYKHGAGVGVYPQENKQLLCYAMCAIQTLKIKPKIIRLCIFQPRIEDGFEFKFWEISFDELLCYAKEIDDALKRIKAGNPPYFAGTHCRWCRAKSICKEYNEDIEEKALGLINKQPLPPLYSLTNEQLSRLVLHKKEIEGYLKDVYSHVLQSAEMGVTYPGLKVVQGRSVRKWRKESEVIEALKHEGLHEEQIFNTKLKGILEIEKKLGKEKVDGLTEKKEERPKLVADSDPGKAIELLTKLN